LIPLYDDNPRRVFPIVTIGFILLNVLVFIWQAITPEQVMFQFTMIPSAITQGQPGLIPVGEGRAIAIPSAIQPAWLTIFSSMFMHGGLAHIGGNMLYLWIFGDNIESDLGHGKFIVFYLLVGVAAAIAHILGDPGSRIPTLGASGAVAGVMGGYILLHPRADVHSLVPLGFFITLVRVPAFIVLGLWFVYQVALNSMGQLQPGGGGVAYLAHIGGFLAGLILIKLFGPDTRRAPRQEYYER